MADTVIALNPEQKSTKLDSSQEDVNATDDVDSVAGSTSLTLDSLEEEAEDPDFVTETPANLDSSSDIQTMPSDGSDFSDDGTRNFYLHSDKCRSKVGSNGKQKLKVSKLAVHSKEISIITPSLLGKEVMSGADNYSTAESSSKIKKPSDTESDAKSFQDSPETEHWIASSHSVNKPTSTSTSTQKVKNHYDSTTSPSSSYIRTNAYGHLEALNEDMSRINTDNMVDTEQTSTSTEGIAEQHSQMRADRSNLGLQLKDIKNHEIIEGGERISSGHRSQGSTPSTMVRNGVCGTNSPSPPARSPTTPTRGGSRIPRKRSSDSVVSQAGSGSGRSTPQLPTPSPSHRSAASQSSFLAAVQRSASLNSADLISRKSRRASFTSVQISDSASPQPRRGSFTSSSLENASSGNSTHTSSSTQPLSKSAGASPSKSFTGTTLSPANIRRNLALNSADGIKGQREHRRSAGTSSMGDQRAKGPQEQSPFTKTQAFGKRSSWASKSLGASPVKRVSSSPSPGRVSPASLPQSPLRLAGSGLRRSASQSDTDAQSLAEVCSGCCTGVPDNTRENLSSRLRYEKHHGDHHRNHHDQGQLDSCYPESTDAYLTPFQRKDLHIRELRQHVRQLNRQMAEKEEQEETLRERWAQEKHELQAKLLAEVGEAHKATETAHQELTSLKEAHEQSLRTIAVLQKQLEDVSKEMALKLSQAEEIFLEMYNKGRESAIFEREEELELQKKGGRSADATEMELRIKLDKTQAELAKWQTIQRHQSYHTAPIPATEAETTLRFLKDSVFHFLTTDTKSSDEHLRAIVRILHFSDVQREKIALAIIHKRNKTGW